MRTYILNPRLVAMKDELLEGIQELMTAGNSNKDDLAMMLGITLAISYCHEFFRMMQIISDQIAVKRG